jgi:hypothetical protein
LLRPARAPVGRAVLLRTYIDGLADPDPAVISDRIVELIEDQHAADF